MGEMSGYEELEAGGKNLRWFADNYKLLQERFPDKFVAVDRENLVEAHDSLDQLLEKVEGRVNPQSLVVQFVPAKDRITII